LNLQDRGLYLRTVPLEMRSLELLSVVAPMHNEEETVDAFYERVRTALQDVGPWQLVIVDDGSTDGTRQILDGSEWPPNGQVLKHDRNQGKGAAVRTALAAARGEFAAIFDADLEYDPNDLGKLLPPLVSGNTNAVFGVRAFDGYTSHSFLFVLGNKGVTLVANVLFNVYLRDLMTCHKAIRTDVFRQLPLQARGFDIEPEIAARLLQHGERIFEVPVHYKARSTDEGKKLTAMDGLRVIATLVRCRVTK
jgi:dolichol-phosphate hexosyltransferase